MHIYYLYVKTHRKTGLKYLGQTRQNPFTYPGSGADWVAHLETYGNDVSTEILLQTESQHQRNEAGRYYSEFFRILTAVDNFGNRIWANRIIESGGGAGGKLGVKRKYSTVQKLKQANRGKNNPMFGTIWITNGTDNKKVQSDCIVPSGWRRGRVFQEEHQLKFNKRCQKGSNNTNYDPTILHWINLDTGEQVLAPKYDFCEMKNLNSRKIRAVVQGKLREHQGWCLKLS